MPKRIALFVVGVVLAVGAFLLYQNWSGTSLRGGMGSGLKNDPVPKGNGGKLTDGVEGRDENGRLEYVITAAKAPEPVKDDAGNPIPGRYEITGPVATLYDKSGRIIEIRGDSATISVDTGPKGIGAGSGLAGLGGSGKKGIPVRSGQLKGHVRLTISAEPADDPALPAKAPKNNKPVLEAGMCIYFDGPVKLDHSSDMSQEIVQSDQAVHVRSESADFDGAGMRLVFNVNAQRIERLLIDRGDVVVIRKVGKDALNLNGAATKPAPPPPAAAAVAATMQAAATQPIAKSAPGPTTYRMNFDQNVNVTVGESRLLSQQLYLLFKAGGRSGDVTDVRGEPAVPGANGPSATAPAAIAGNANAGPATAPAWPEEPAPIGPAGKDDLVVRWTGPMEMRPSDGQDLKLVDSNDVALEAVGPADKPVEVHDPRFAAKAGRLWYHAAESRIKLEPGDFQHVEMADAVRGSVVCTEMDFYQRDNHAELLGPGTLVVKAQPAADGTPSKAGPTTVTWKSRMELVLVDGKADPKDPEKKGSPLVRSAKIFGAGIKSDSFELTCDMLDVLIANVDDKKGGTTPAMEHLVALGNVVVNSFRGGATGVEPDGLRAPRMEILTKVPADGGAPVPSQLIAEGGNVSAWRHIDKTKATTTAPAGVAVARVFEKDMVQASKIVADLAPRPKNELTKATDAGLAGLGQGYETTHFTAIEDVTVDVAPPEASKRIVAAAKELEADLLAGTASLKGPGANGKNGLVHVVIGAAAENTVDGGTILLTHLLNQDEIGFEVPGPGKFHFTLPTEKGKERKPLEVSWTHSMTFDNKSKLAVFNGKTVAQSDGDKSDLAKLTAEKLMRVHLISNSDLAATATRPANGTDLSLDYIYAEGNVDAGGAQLDEKGGMISWMDLQAEKLTYSNTKKLLQVPGEGKMALEDKRPEDKSVLKSGDQSLRGTAVFTWKGGLEYDGPGNLITFTKDVTFDYKPQTPFSFISAPAGGAPAKSNANKKPEIAHLTTDKLVATLTQAKGKTGGKTVSSPIGLGTNGNQDLSHVDATGHAVLGVGTDYTASGDSLSYDVQKQIAIINGTPDDLVVLVRPNEPTISAERVTWNMMKNDNSFETVAPRLNGFSGK